MHKSILNTKMVKYHTNSYKPMCRTTQKWCVTVPTTKPQIELKTTFFLLS